MGEAATTSLPPPAPQPGLLARVIGVIFSPRDTYAAVAARPRWLGVMAITLVISAACQYVTLSSPELQDNIIDRQVRAMRESGGGSDQQIAGVESVISRLPVIYTVVTIVFGPLIVAAVAGILLLIFSMLLGGSATFRQVFAMVAHAGVISTIAGMFSAALTLAGVPPNGIQPPSANLGVFTPFLEEMSFLAVFLGTFNLILIWWLLSTSIGLGVLYRRRTGPIFIGFMFVYVVIAAIVAAVSS